MRKLQIGVIGPAKGEYPKSKKLGRSISGVAENIGELLSKENVIVITGGGGGVMEAVSRGAKRKNGITVGTPGRNRKSSNKYIDIEILTPIDTGDFLFAGILSSDAIIAIPGGAGTLSEVCLAYRYKKPIIILRGFNKNYDKLINNYLDESKSVLIEGAKTPEEAVRKAIRLAKGK
ncbi:TIGR00725 family protein [Candidatus Shapirobacteria bacterium]|nr:TIGR00725 family protein [Candidatus Shapirobacteria bacterium]